MLEYISDLAPCDELWTTTSLQSMLGSGSRSREAAVAAEPWPCVALDCDSIMPRCANPLFLRWVKQFHDEKDYRKRGGPPRATGYENAIRALETCTETYAHPVDMRGKVSGVGPTTIDRCVPRLYLPLRWVCYTRTD